MAKQIIIQRIERGPGGDTNVNYLLWLTVAGGREIPIPNAVSAWGGASTAENAAIAAGQIIEEPGSTQYLAATSKAAIQADLAVKLSNRQLALSTKLNPNLYYGAFFDSISGWSA